MNRGLSSFPRSRFSAIAALAGIALLILLPCAVIALCFNARAVAAAYATHALGHRVSVGSMTVGFHPLVITLDDVRVANAAWGSQPDMAQLGHVLAELEIKPLLHGKLKFRRLLVDHATLLLKRNAQGVGNWKKSDTPSPSAQTPAAKAASRRHGFPTILDLTAHDSRIVMITSSGATLRIDFNDAHLHANDEDQPVTLNADGAYKDIPLHIDINAGSFAEFHDIEIPFNMELTAKGATATAEAKLLMMDPLNFDQFNGWLRIEAKNAGKATGFFANPLSWDIPFRMECGFAREGDSWTFSSATGSLAGNEYNDSGVHLQEGNHETPDRIRATLHFKSMDIDSLLRKSGEASAHKSPALAANASPRTLLDAQLNAEKLSYGKLTATHFASRAVIAPDMKALEDITMELFGGRLRATAQLKANEKTSELTLKASLPHAEAQQIAEAWHGGNQLLRGTLNASLSATATGDDLKAWSHTANGTFRLSVTNGKISRHLIRLASTDLRALFRSDESAIPMPCMAAVATFRDGIGALSPFRVETAEGTLLGGGGINLPLQRMDLAFQTDHDTTSGLALDIPIRVTGNFGSPQLLPAGDGNLAADLEKSRHAGCGAAQ